MYYFIKSVKLNEQKIKKYKIIRWDADEDHEQIFEKHKRKLILLKKHEIKNYSKQNKLNVFSGKNNVTNSISFFFMN